MRKFHFLFVGLILFIVLFLYPVQYAFADDNTSSEIEEEYSRMFTPKVLDSELKFNKKSFFSWFGLKDIPEETIIEELVFAHSIGNYDAYYFVAEFELKTQLDDGSIVTTVYTAPSIDLSQYSSGFWDSILVSLNLKDDYYQHVFDYRELVKNAEGFKEYDVTGKGNYTYNTVISQADFYFIDKEGTGKYDSRRYKFTWDEDFTMQLCTKISFSWYRFPTEEAEGYEKEIDSVESNTGVDGYSTNVNDSYLGLDNSAWEQLIELMAGVPAAVIAFVVGFLNIMSGFSELLNIVFPFVPGSICTLFVFMLFFGVIWGILKFVKGFF